MMLKPITHLRFDNNQAICRVGSPITPVGTPVFGKGRFGSCLLMNGTNNRFDVAKSWGIPANGDFCLEMWIYPTYSSGYTYLFSTGRDATGITRLELRYGSPSLGPTVGGSYFEGTAPVTPNNWHFIVIDRCAGMVRTYCNGLMVASQANSLAVDDHTNIKIGSNWSSAEYFNGGIDEIRFSAFSRYRGTNFKVPRYPLDSPSKDHRKSLLTLPSVSRL
jgi:hypothetical protein